MKRFLKVVLAVICLLAVLGAAAFAFLPLPGQVPVLMYHFLGSREDALASKNFVEPENFRKQMEFLKRFGYRVISLDDLYEIKEGRRKPLGREIAITFDDGNVSFVTEAFPILKNYEYPVTLFLVTEAMKHETHGAMSEGTVHGLLENPWIHIGAHTRTHPILSELPEEKIRDEVVTSKLELEKIFNRPVLYMAYPSGDFNAAIGKIVQEAGYRLAFTTSPKKLKSSEIGPFSMLRVKISRSADNPFVFWFKISGLYETFKRGRQASQEGK